MVPHITDAIQDWIERVAHTPVDGRDGLPDVCVIELGGTVGDIESMPFIEALRQFQFRVGAGEPAPQRCQGGRGQACSQAPWWRQQGTSGAGGCLQPACAAAGAAACTWLTPPRCARPRAGNFVTVHVSLVPVIGVVGEQKTKPTQHSVAMLRSLGLNPALLACRSSEPLQGQRAPEAGATLWGLWGWDPCVCL